MGFRDTIFPTNENYGSTGGPGGSFGVLTMDSGQDRIIDRWDQFRHRYDVAWTIKNHADLNRITRFFLSLHGLANSFRFLDWQDYTTKPIGMDWTGTAPISDTDQQFGVGDGVTVQFPLVKRYEDDDETGVYVRNITKPIASTVVLAVAGTPTPTGWSVNADTGLITFDAPPAVADPLTWGGHYHVETRFGEAAGEFFGKRINSFGAGEVPSLPLIEVMPGDVSNEDVHRGGAKLLTFSADVTIDIGATDWSFVPDVANRIVYLPLISNIPYGAPTFVFHNLTANQIHVNRSEGPLDLVFNLPANGSAMVTKGYNTAGDPQWFSMVF